MQLVIEAGGVVWSEVLEEIARGKGVPKVKQSQQSLAREGFVILRTLWVASRILEVWVSRSRFLPLGRAKGW